MRSPSALLAILVLLGPAGARTDASDRLEYEPSLDVPLTLVGAAGTFAPRVLTRDTGTWTCRWCDRDADGRDTLNRVDAAVRRHWRWADEEKAHAWSNATLSLSLVAPATAYVVGRGGFGDGFGAEVLLVLESSALTLAATQGTKYLLRRERPWVHAGEVPPGQHPGSRDSTLSFVSGHSSLSFALAVTLGSMASLRGVDGKEWVWATGLTFAGATAYLRIAADRHYFTDVLAGAAIGAAVGWAVPRLIERRPAFLDRAAVAHEARVPLFRLALGAPRRGGAGSAVVLIGGVQGEGGFVSASFGF